MDGTYSCEGDRQYQDPPRGIYGGWDGLTASTHKNPGTPQEEYLEAKVTGIEFKAGEFIEFREPNAGGYGDPLDRPPAMVREDVLDDFTTIELAREAYGVIFVDEGDLEIDEEATKSRRDEIRASRNGDRDSLERLFSRAERPAALEQPNLGGGQQRLRHGLGDVRSRVGSHRGPARCGARRLGGRGGRPGARGQPVGARAHRRLPRADRAVRARVQLVPH